MDNKKDGLTLSTVDFAEHSDSALIESLRNVNSEKFPANHKAIILEIEKRKNEGLWQIESTPVNSLRKGSGGSLKSYSIPDSSRELSFKFLGSGTEYFPIWVSNFFLSIITLGFYTPWAKVRAQRYFYSRTILDNHNFSYMGDPKKILVGRLILAIIAIIVFLNNILGFIPLRTYLLLILVGLLILPFIVWKSANFNFSNSSYRGIFFSLDLKLSKVYKWAFFTVLKILFTFGILLTTLSYQYRSFFLSHLQFGKTKFSHRSSQIAVLRKIVPLALLLGFALMIISLVVFRITPDVFATESALNWAGFLTFLAIADSITAQYLFDYLEIGPIQFRARFDKWQLARLYLKAGIYSFFTLGFAWPWVRIEILRYKLEQITVYAPEGALEQFVCNEENLLNKKVAGGFATEFFEFDLGI